MVVDKLRVIIRSEAWKKDTEKVNGFFCRKWKNVLRVESVGEFCGNK